MTNCYGLRYDIFRDECSRDVRDLVCTSWDEFDCRQGARMTPLLIRTERQMAILDLLGAVNTVCRRES